MAKVLVLGTDGRSTLTVIRSLGRQGIEVHLAWCGRDAVPAASRYVSQWHDLPFPASYPESWREPLKALLEREAYDLVIPTGDREIIPLQLEREAWCSIAPFYLLPDDVFIACYDKAATTRLVESLGIPQPPWQQVESIEQLIAAAEAMSYPLVLKPISSFDLQKISHDKRHVQRVFEPSELEAIAAPMLQGGALIVQENFIGVGCGVELLAKDGEILASFQHQRVHEAPHGSGSSYRKSVPVYPEMGEAAAKLVKALNYTGVMMIEFKQNLDTGEWIFIEINARFWGSLPLPVAAGVDFPFLLYQLMTEQPVQAPASYPSELHARNSMSDLRWFWVNLRTDRSDPRLNTQPIGKTLKELGHIFTGNECNDTLVKDDWKPALQELKLQWQRVEAKLMQLWVKLRWKESSYRERRQAIFSKKWQKAEKVLFMCKGNICRSPFAHLLAERELPQKIYRSAGYYPEAGRSSPDVAQQVAAEMGVDLSQHRSSLLDKEAIDWADIIIGFDAAHMQHIATYFPEARTKSFVLGEATAAVATEITDPYGGDQAQFSACYQRIIKQMEPLG